MCDRKARQVCDLGNDALMVRRGRAGLSREDRERANDVAVRRADGRGPAAAEPELGRDVSVLRPQRIADHVVDNHRCVAVRSRAARTLGRPNLEAIERLCVGGRKASGSRVPEPMVIGIHQHDRDERVSEDPLHHPADTVKDRFQCLALC